MATYTHEQLSYYYERIGWDPTDAAVDATLDPSLEHLEALLLRHLACVPFENISLHYSPTHLLSLDPEALFDKIVERGRGGYCMEVNAFFAAVLRSLGYVVMSVGARVSDATAGLPGGGYSGWSHMLNLVTIADTRYVVDVGFGRTNPCRPLPLVSGREVDGVGAQRLHLEYTAVPQHSDRAQRLWVYSTREHTGAPWTPGYAFAEVEFFPADFAIMNLATMTLRSSFFLQFVMCVRVVVRAVEWSEERADDGTSGGDSGAGTGTGTSRRPVGTLVLFGNSVKVTENGETRVLQELASEADRAAALERWFGIRLSEADRRGIRGLATELK